MTQSIILLDRSPLVRGMLRRIINKQPGLRIVAEVDDYSCYREAVLSTEAEWTILVLDPGEDIPEIIDQVLGDRPSMRLLVMAIDGSQVRLKWIEPHDEILADASLDDLFAIITDPETEQKEVDV